MCHSIITINNTKTIWDWILFGLSMAAAIAAVGGFVTWWVQNRKRSEYMFIWILIDKDGSEQEWKVNDSKSFEIGQIYDVQCRIHNIGTVGGPALVNVIVPRFMELFYEVPGQHDRQDKEYLGLIEVDEPAIGKPSDAKFAFIIEPDIGPGVTAIVKFQVKIEQFSLELKNDHYIAISVENGKLNPELLT